MSDEFDPVLEKLFEDPLLHRPAPTGWIANALSHVDSDDLSRDTALFEVHRPAENLHQNGVGSEQNRSRLLAVAAAIVIGFVAIGAIFLGTGREPSTVVADAPESSGTGLPPPSSGETALEPLIDRPPVAMTDQVFLPFDAEGFEMDVLANDQDPDGDELSLLSATFPDIEGLALQFEIVSDSSVRLSLLRQDGIERGTPSFTGSYLVSDPAGNVSQGEIVVTIGSRPREGATEISCTFSDFIATGSGSGWESWTETWEWVSPPDVVSESLLVQIDGEDAIRDIGTARRWSEPGHTGLPDDGSALLSITSKYPKSWASVQVGLCGTYGGSGWVAPPG